MRNILLLISCLLVFPVFGQKNNTSESPVLEGLNFRSIGPFRGGRSAAVTGVPGQPNLFYMGATGGGVWRTKDAGQRWENISDGFFGGSVGAVAVSDWDPNVIYVGGGEVTIRGNVSYGYGMWKSVDAGKSWTHAGLPNSRHIPRVRIHPKNPDLVYAAVLGDLYKDSEDRGVYRSKDGGNTWERILYTNSRAGAVDLTFDPSNPRILYASTWNVRRTPYSLESGGPGSALWKSTDGGDTWTNMMEQKGMPDGPIGIIGVTVSPVNPQRVWAIIEAPEGGVFRSDDGGDKWVRINDERKLRQRAWYYSRIYADTEDADKVYVVNVGFHRSKDGGKSWERIRTPHGDHHDLWIAPEDAQRMIIGDDGGAQVSLDGGDNWSTYMNQPTAQYYRVTTDDHFPYRIYVAQQDNSTLRVSHRSNGRTIGERDWEPTAGGESAHIAPDPDDNDIVYGGSYGGFLTRKNHKTGETRAINVWPDNPLGHGAEGMKYRFQWNFPIFFSPHDGDKLYAASQHLHVSTDEGQSWQIISPDLTRNDSAKLVSSGGIITQDNTGVEYYCTIFAAAESPLEAGVIWAGSDDGLLHITRDGGKNWTKVTPSGMPEWCQINSIEVDPFEKGGLYVAATSYKWGDYQPYLFRTKDYGKSWKKIVAGIAPDHFTRVVRADPVKQGVLYAGTESVLYMSANDGESWTTLQLNLPIVPITDLAIKNNNLIVATQGRSIWILDDMTVLHQAIGADKGQPKLFAPITSYRMPGSAASRPSLLTGQNHPGGVNIHFYLPQKPDSNSTLEMVISAEDGTEIRRFSTQSKEKENKLKGPEKGLNTFRWDMRYPAAKEVKGMILWWAQLDGPKALPGTYQVRMKMGDVSQTQTFEIKMDPRSSATKTDMQAQFDFLIKNRDKLTEMHEAILDMRSLKKQLSDWKSKASKDSSYTEISEMASSLMKELDTMEETLYQNKSRSPQDPLNFPIRLNNKLGHLGSLTSMGAYAPTDQAIAVQKMLFAEIDAVMEQWKETLSEKVPAFNALVEKAALPALDVD